MSEWVRVIDEALVCAGIGVADDGDSYQDAKKKLNDLIVWNIEVSAYMKAGGDK